jgi:outer membrane immunogenic protein
MKRVSLVSVALLALVGGAWPAAVDAQPAYNWTGFYVGANLGGAAGGSDHASNLSGPGLIYGAVPNVVQQINSASKQDLSTGSITGGIQGGYNYMLGNVLFGAELDFNAFPQSGTSNVTQKYDCAGFGCTSTFTVRTTVSTDWLLTARPRLGYALGGFLPYVTGGLAVTDLSAKWRFTETFGSMGERAQASAVKPGWTAGFGFEYGVTQNWTIKAEYLYVNFGKLFSTGLAVRPSVPADSIVISNYADLHSNIGRLGLNYKF